MVTGGLRLGQKAGGDQTRGVRQGNQTRGGETGRDQARSGQSKMPTDGLTSSISRFDEKVKIHLLLCSRSFPQFLEEN